MFPGRRRSANSLKKCVLGLADAHSILQAFQPTSRVSISRDLPRRPLTFVAHAWSPFATLAVSTEEGRFPYRIFRPQNTGLTQEATKSSMPTVEHSGAPPKSVHPVEWADVLSDAGWAV